MGTCHRRNYFFKFNWQVLNFFGTARACLFSFRPTKNFDSPGFALEILASRLINFFSHNFFKFIFALFFLRTAQISIIKVPLLWALQDKENDSSVMLLRVNVEELCENYKLKNSVVNLEKLFSQGSLRFILLREFFGAFSLSHTCRFCVEISSPGR